MTASDQWKKSSVVSLTVGIICLKKPLTLLGCSVRKAVLDLMSFE